MLAVPVFDAHTHLDAMAQRAGVPADAAFVAAAMARARAVGVLAAITVGDTVASSRWCADAAAAHPDVRAAVAVHPTEVAGLDDAGYAELERLAADCRRSSRWGRPGWTTTGTAPRRPCSRSTSAATSIWPSGSASR